MPAYLPQTDENVRQMLETIGAKSVEDLFHDVPQKYRFPELKLPKPLSEMEILSELYSLALKNSSTGCYATFLGAGAYNHFVPAPSHTWRGAASSSPPTHPTNRR